MFDHRIEYDKVFITQNTLKNIEMYSLKVITYLCEKCSSDNNFKKSSVFNIFFNELIKNIFAWWALHPHPTAPL